MSYTIEAGSAPGLSDLASVSTGNAATSYSVSGVLAGSYWVRIRAANGSGISTPSNETLLVVRDCVGPPTSPTLAATSNLGAVTLTWSGATGGVASYVLEAGSRFGATDLANNRSAKRRDDVHGDQCRTRHVLRSPACAECLRRQLAVE